MLHFEVQVKQGARSDYLQSVLSPSQYPSYILVFNDDWSDYNCYTWFSLFRFQSRNDKSFIGELKIMRHNESNTYDALDKRFDEPLADDFCSLGISPNYYSEFCEKILDIDERHEVLYFLRDCAWNSQIYELFVDDEIFNKSLLRDMSSEKALRDGKFILAGKNSKEAYSFKFAFSYCQDDETIWDVHFDYKNPDFMRCIGLIGENGIGKTRMLSKMVEELVDTEENVLTQTLFNSCLVLCSTPLDKYPLPKIQGNRIPYERYSLEQDTEETECKLIETARRILNRPRWNNMELREGFMEKLAMYFGGTTDNIYKVQEEEDKEIWTVNKEEISRLVTNLSSGELHTLLLLSHIYANIHLSSLLVIDEPEVHLHPSIIKDFMIFLCDILADFQSFAIVATHTPLIVREIANTNVFLMRRNDGGLLQIGTVPFDTFGEDTTRLFQNIFGYDEADSYFIKVVKELRNNIMSYDEIVDYLEQYMQLSFNSKLLIRDICSK